MLVDLRIVKLIKHEEKSKPIALEKIVIELPTLINKKPATSQQIPTNH